MAATNLAVAPFLNKVNAAIINPLLVLVFAIATMVFIFGIFQFISSQTTDKGREEGKRKIIYGLVGMFVMFSAYGIIHLILVTFTIPTPSYPAGF